MKKKKLLSLTLLIILSLFIILSTGVTTFAKLNNLSSIGKAVKKVTVKIATNSIKCKGSVLRPGDTLEHREYLQNGPYILYMQPDANLVLYHSDRAIWSTRTNVSNFKDRFELGSVSLIMQHDGNLVLYSTFNTDKPRAIWETDTHLVAGWYNTFLSLQSDGNLVLYSKEPRLPIWATNTCGK